MGCIWSTGITPGGSPISDSSGGKKYFGSLGRPKPTDKTREARFSERLVNFFDISNESFVVSDNFESDPKEITKVTITKYPNGSKKVNQYAILKKLGSGSYGKVKLCVDIDTEKFYAIKICNKGMLRRQKIGMSTALQVTIFL